MFFAVMLVCSPMNLIYHENECFGIEDTKGYYSTEAKCNKRTNEMENELLNVINYPAVIRKNCIKVKLEAV